MGESWRWLLVSRPRRRSARPSTMLFRRRVPTMVWHAWNVNDVRLGCAGGWTPTGCGTLPGGSTPRRGCAWKAGYGIGSTAFVRVGYPIRCGWATRHLPHRPCRHATTPRCARSRRPARCARHRQRLRRRSQRNRGCLRRRLRPATFRKWWRQQRRWWRQRWFRWWWGAGRDGHLDERTLREGRSRSGSVVDIGLGTFGLPIETIRRWACIGTITPVVVSADGTRLLLGHETRLANAVQRRALRVLYRSCALCDTAFDMCQIHHVGWYSLGGYTDIRNLLPLCSRHHHLVHQGGWVLHWHPTAHSPSPHQATTSPCTHHPTHGPPDGGRVRSGHGR